MEAGHAGQVGSLFLTVVVLLLVLVAIAKSRKRSRATLIIFGWSGGAFLLGAGAGLALGNGYLAGLLAGTLAKFAAAGTAVWQIVRNRRRRKAEPSTASDTPIA